MHSEYLFAALSLFAVTTATSTAKRQLASNLPTGWTYQGCYSDAVSDRVLSGASYTNASSMTQESCITYCSSAGYSVAGVEYSDECYCDHELASSSTKEADADCNMACSGDSAEVCGAGNRLTVFSTEAAPIANPGPDGWAFLGCYSDSTGARTLRYRESVSSDSGLSVAQCTATCRKYGFQYAGVEYADECYCDNSLQNGGSLASSGCDMTCSGNSSEYCGGPNRLDLYEISPTNSSGSAGTIPADWNSLGCFTDDVSVRTLAQGQAVPGGYTNMTVENCISACQSAGYNLAGVEYSQECYCDNQPENSGSCASDQTTCNMPCKGDSSETCGGPNRLNMYQYGSGTVASCSATQASTSAASTTLATSTSTFGSTSSTSAVAPNSVTAINTTSSSSSLVVATTGVATTSASSPYSNFTSLIATLNSSIPATVTTGVATTSASPHSNLTSIVATSNSSIHATATTSAFSTAILSSAFNSSRTVILLSSSSSSVITTVTSPSSTSRISNSTAPTSTSTSPLLSATSISSITTTSIRTTSTISATTTTTSSSCSVSTSSTGLVQNGGFESGLTPWTSRVFSGDVQIKVITDGTAYSGCSSLIFVPSSYSYDQAQISQYVTGAVAGKTYTLSFQAGLRFTGQLTTSPILAIVVGSYPINQIILGGGRSMTFTAPSAAFNLAFVLNWQGTYNPPTVVLDAISIS